MNFFWKQTVGKNVQADVHAPEHFFHKMLPFFFASMFFAFCISFILALPNLYLGLSPDLSSFQFLLRKSFKRKLTRSENLDFGTESSISGLGDTDDD